MGTALYPEFSPAARCETFNSANVHEIQILMDDYDFLAVYKPPHLVTHPSKPSHFVSLLAEMHRRFPGEWLACVNRLDRETSGIVLFAKNPDAARKLQKLWIEGKVKKTYEAICWGYYLRDKVIVNFPIGANTQLQGSNTVRVQQCCRTDGAPSVTHAWVRRRAKGMTWFCARPLTGRLHQIRVHLAAIGHPVVGDKIYGPSTQCYLDFIRYGWTPQIERLLWLKRHALHASELEFVWKREKIRIFCPLPRDLEELWQKGESVCKLEV